MSYFLIASSVLLVIYVLSAWCVVGLKYLVWRKQNSSITLRPVNRPTFFVRPNQEQHLAVCIKHGEQTSELEKTPADVVLLVDNSGSMNGDRINEAKLGTKIFIENVNLSQGAVNIGIAAFNSSGSIINQLSNNRKSLLNAANYIPQPNGGTNLYEGLRSAQALLESEPENIDQDRKQYIVVISDGGVSDKVATLALAEELKRDGVSIICLAVANADIATLSEVAGLVQDNIADNASDSADDTYVYHCQEADQMVALFDTIRTLIEVDRQPVNINVNLPLNQRDIQYLGTSSNHQQSYKNALGWFLPMVNNSGDEIRFYHSAVACLGFVDINLGPLEFVSRNEHGEIKETHQNDARYSIAVIPFWPSWLFVSLLHPSLWPFLQRWCAKHQRSGNQELLSQQTRRMSALASSATVQCQRWQPTVCIGLGGAGIEAMSRMKALAMDSSFACEWESSMRFFAIDTDNQADHKRCFGLAVIDDFIGIGDDLYDEHLASMSDSQRNPWYSAALNQYLDREMFDTTNGANGNRLLGRLALALHLRNSDLIVKKLDELAAWLASQPDASKRKIVLFASATGGTGSAIVFDLAQMLLSEIDKRSLACTVELIIPDQPKRVLMAADLTTSNEMAFLLELERLKAAEPYGIASTTLANVEQCKRSSFLDAQYYVTGSPDAISAAASLAISLVNANKSNDSAIPLNLHEDIAKNIINRQQVNAGYPKDIISVNAALECCPLFASDVYLEKRFVLSLMHNKFGIAKGQQGYDLSVALDSESSDSHLMALLTQIPNTDSPLTQTLPILFQYVYSISASSGENISDLLEESLNIMPDMRIKQESDANLHLAVLRILRWVLDILNRDDAGLANAAHLLSELEIRLLKVIALVHNQGISDGSGAESILLFQAEPLNQLNQLLYNYVFIVQKTASHLQSWRFTLTEGLYQQQHVGTDLGLARTLDREKELAIESIRDYPNIAVEQFQQDLDKQYLAIEQTLDERKRAYSERIFWQFDASYLGNSNLFRQLFESGLSPVLLCVSDRKGEAKLFMADGGANEVQRIHQVMTDLVKDPQLQADYSRALTPPAQPSAVTQELSYTARYDHTHFIRNAFNAALSFSAAHQFRDGNPLSKLKQSDAYMRGYRHHVRQADMDAAILQRSYADGIRLEPPIHPLVGWLMQDLHRTQRYLYLCLQGQVTEGVTQDNTLKWQVSDDNASYFLSAVQSSSHFAAAIQFVLKRVCQESTQPILVDEFWRPTALDIACLGTLSDHALPASIHSFVDSFQPLLAIMQNSNGYIESVGQLSYSFFEEMLMGSPN